MSEDKTREQIAKWYDDWNAQPMPSRCMDNLIALTQRMALEEQMKLCNKLIGEWEYPSLAPIFLHNKMAELRSQLTNLDNSNKDKETK
jgi:hypothetical protein